MTTHIPFTASDLEIAESLSFNIEELGRDRCRNCFIGHCSNEFWPTCSNKFFVFINIRDRSKDFFDESDSADVELRALWETIHGKSGPGWTITPLF